MASSPAEPKGDSSPVRSGSPFVTKTYQMVDDPSVDDLISWSEDGSAFIVWRPAEFARDLLPTYFKHNNFTTFVRHLNIFGFRKVAPDRWEFAHDCFKKGEKGLLREIWRRKMAPAPLAVPTVLPAPLAVPTVQASIVTPSSSKYDVFLGCGGEDTRKGFRDHLCLALTEHKVKVYIEDKEQEPEPEPGQSITDEVKQAIRGSRTAIVVFSRSFADSTRCLEELVEIVECRKRLGLMVFPVYYDINPLDVRWQSGSFSEAFQKHRDNEEIMVKIWRNALTEVAMLPRMVFRSTDEYEGTFIRAIIGEVTRELESYLDSGMHPIGIDSRVQEISNSLDVGGSNDVRIIGIWGMGGVGKTTVAKAIFHRDNHSFDGKSFLQDVKNRKLFDLQEQLLVDILKPLKIEISSVDEGTHVIERRLHSLRLLVIIDDVDSVEQLDALAIKRGSFGLGSRIIITTRNVHLLNILRVDKTCLIQPLNKEEALKLLSWYAFGKTTPEEGYLELSREVADYCGGLPLALEIIGSSLCTKSTTEWKSELHQFKRRLHGEIHKKLKLSYDELTDYLVKALFLDIACFFTGMEKDYVMMILEGCDLYPEIGIGELLDRCLLTVDNEGSLMMHDFIRDMGREIMHAESPEKPGKRSRLWHHEDVTNVLMNNSGRDVIEGLTLDLPESNNASFSTEGFKKMQGLRLLKLKGVKLTGTFKHLSKELRWLSWHGFPLEVIPEDFYQQNLVAVDLSYSKLIEVWEDSDVLLEKLKIIILSHSHDLKKSPDFSRLPNIERLILDDCKSLSEVHHSIVRLMNLKILSLASCSLTDDVLPEDLGGLSSLEVLDLRGNNFFRLPILSGLSKLQTLKLAWCPNLQAITDLPTNLEILVAGECIGLERMPDFSSMSCMRELYVDHSPKLTEIPGLHMSLHSMRIISMGGCTNLTTTFKDRILKGWSTHGDGGVFLPGNDIPTWVHHVNPGGGILDFVVPPISRGDLKALTVCMVYSSDNSESSGELGIVLLNLTQCRNLVIYPASVTVVNSNEDYLWLGHLSNNQLNFESGDNVRLRGHILVLGLDADHYKVKKVGVSMEYERPLKEYTLDCVSAPYDSKFYDNLTAGPSGDTRKRLRSDAGASATSVSGQEMPNRIPSRPDHSKDYKVKN